MLRLAMKAIPLRHDAEPLDILFEDEHLIAFNKPPGVLTAPKHRYMVRTPSQDHSNFEQCLHGTEASGRFRNDVTVNLLLLQSSRDTRCVVRHLIKIVPHCHCRAAAW